ncbi:S8 family serine peptidase [Micromonosporaceae bacterium Da 78-11]
MRALGALLTAATTAALTGIAVPAQAAEGRVIGADAAGALPGRYIVTLKKHSGGMSALDAVDLGDATVIKRSGSVITAGMTGKQARRLAANSAVQYVEQDRILHVEGTQANPTWGLDRIDQRPVKAFRTYTPTDDGNTVHAYVIDTGIRVTHTEFGGRAAYGYDFVDGDRTAADCNGHGTHVAGTIGGAHYGVAKKVRLVAVRVLGCEGEGLLSDVIDGVNWVTENAVLPAVANMSMGGGYSPALESAVQESIDAGITYAVAAGNEDENALNSSPAGLAAAITVGATDSRDRRASFSNFGGVLDLFAPGVNIKSSVSGSNTATAVYSGTSMAAPHVAGAAALVLDAFPAYTPAQVRNFLVAQATTGKVTDRVGSPNRLLFVPAPAKAPVIATAKLTATRLHAYAGKLALTANRRGSWSLAAGTLPAGLRLAANGVISGTPTTPGTRTVHVRFTDYVPNTVTRNVTVTVQNTTPVITATDLVTASSGTGYSGQLSVADARTGTWSLVAGALPDGLTLAATGVIAGVPSAAGTANFTVSFADPYGATATRDFVLIVQ